MNSNISLQLTIVILWSLNQFMPQTRSFAQETEQIDIGSRRELFVRKVRRLWTEWFQRGVLPALRRATQRCLDGRRPLRRVGRDDRVVFPAYRDIR